MLFTEVFYMCLERMQGIQRLPTELSESGY